jgi:hypothetical protein
MLEAGWPVDVRGAEGHARCTGRRSRQRRDVQILRHHPPVDVRGDAYDGPPVHWAIYGSVHGWHPDQGDYGRTVQLLLEAGAKRRRLTVTSRQALQCGGLATLPRQR